VTKLQKSFGKLKNLEIDFHHKNIISVINTNPSHVMSDRFPTTQRDLKFTPSGKSPKIRISYSFKNVEQNSCHCFGVNALAIDEEGGFLYSAGRDSVILSWEFGSKQVTASGNKYFLIINQIFHFIFKEMCFTVEVLNPSNRVRRVMLPQVPNISCRSNIIVIG
jgi:hypothetical protein